MEGPYTVDNRGFAFYQFDQVTTMEMAEKIQEECLKRAGSDRNKAVALAIGALASIFFPLLYGNLTITAPIYSVFALAAGALLAIIQGLAILHFAARSEHYYNESERAGALKSQLLQRDQVANKYGIFAPIVSSLWRPSNISKTPLFAE